MFTTSQTFLVTGGAGFIGANFVHLLAKRHPECHIIVLDKLTYAANPESIAGLANVRLVQGDICDRDVVDELVSSVDYVVHFAAESHNDNSLADPTPFIRTNIEGTAVLASACVAHNVPMHHISTDEVFGDLPLDTFRNPEIRFRDTTAYNPSSPYSASKASADHLVRAWVRSFGLKATLSNCSNNYGPYQHPEKFIPRQIINLLNGQSPRLYGEGLNVRDWIHVDDHNDAVLTIIAAASKNPALYGRTFLIGADGEQRNIDVIRQLNVIFGRDPEDFVHVTDRPGHDQRYAIDATPLRQELGWSPSHTDFAGGLEQTVQWYQQNPQWWQYTWAASEKKYSSREEVIDPRS